MPLYALTIFLSAFLLFQVQPMAAKFILPWFGGSTMVWTTSMLFFQVTLVAGYAYSHGVVNRLGKRSQLVVHGILVAIALLFLPIRPDASWKPIDGEFPVYRILSILFVTVGVPFFLLSTTGPLVGRWQSWTHPKQSPYRLYALSNVGSLLALISYPFVTERWFSLGQQSWIWSGTFVAFATSLFGAGWFLGQNWKPEDPGKVLAETTEKDIAESESCTNPSISKWQILLWLLLPALASVQLLATTNLMTQEIGSHPLLWIMPLALYLLTFIICFEFTGFYLRWLFAVGFFVLSVFACSVASNGIRATAPMQIGGFSGVLFFSAMCCHGELAALKPGHRGLTLFYLMVSVGGALGGIAVAVVSPLVFQDYYEFHLSLLAITLLLLILTARDGWIYFRERYVTVWPATGFSLLQICGGIALISVSSFFGDYWRQSQGPTVLHQSRNDYGTLRVSDKPAMISLVNGHTMHGFQLKDPEWHLAPVSYYGPSSGLGVAVNYLRKRNGTESAEGEVDIAAIGMGVGTVSAWTRPQDSVHFFEINSKVETVARDFFTYLEKAEGKVEVSIGDARIQLERQQAADPNRKYDLLIADAFSSDSIPVHLLTLEAFDLYADCLKPGGIMAIHISNRFLVLDNIVKRNAKELGWQAVLVGDDQKENPKLIDSQWVLVTKDAKFVALQTEQGNAAQWSNERYSHLWTDQSASVLEVLRW